jgi:hypothetical protein
MNLKLALIVVLAFAGLFLWPFAEPHFRRWLRSRASRRRRAP